MSIAPKRPTAPPLNAMRAFEAAARHVSFVEAAAELNVTPGAISQQVKVLEGWAGMPLFRRRAQGVGLTPAGRALVGQFSAAFDGLAEATRALRNLQPNADFHIAALPSIAQLWLPRHLSRIRAALPQITFSVTALESPPSLARELFDLSIFFAAPQEGQIALGPDRIQPVCAPVLLPRLEAEFASLPRLEDQSWTGDWPLWAEAAGLPLAPAQSGPRFSLYALAVEEAKAGAGLLMGHLSLIPEALSSGALVPAHPHITTTGRSLVLDLPEPGQRRAETEDVVALLRGRSTSA